jgi:hypothetical protein
VAPERVPFYIPALEIRKKKDPKKIKQNMIRSLVTANDAKSRAMASFANSEDKTTWRKEGVEHCCKTQRGPPKEVEKSLTLHLESATNLRAPRMDSMLN